MTNVPFAAHRGLPRHRVAEPLRGRAWPPGRDPSDRAAPRCGAVSRDNARTPMQWDGRRRTPASPPGTPWIAVNPNHAADQRRRRRSTTPTRCSPTTGALIELRHREPAVAHGDFTMLLPDDRAVYAFTRRWRGTELLVWRTSATTAQPRCRTPTGWAGAELVLGNYPDASASLELRPWEAVVLRRGPGATDQPGPAALRPAGVPTSARLVVRRRCRGTVVNPLASGAASVTTNLWRQT